MGEKNTISLLNSINGYLKTMVEQTKQNKEPGHVTQNTQVTMTKNLNQGSVFSGAVTQQKGKYNDVTISAAMMASLNALPTTILAIGKLKKKDVEAFTKTLLAIQVTINKFAEGSKDIKGANNLVKVIKSLSDLEKVGLIKLATSLKIANTFGIAKSLTKFVEGVSNAARKAGKINRSDLNKLEAVSKNMKSFSLLTKGLAVVMGTVIGMAIAIKAIGTGPILKSVALTLGVLTTLSLIAVGIGLLSRRMTGATRGLRDVAKFIFLMQGAVIGTLLIGVIAQKALPQILKGFAAVSGIIIGYTLIATLVSFISKISPTFKADILAITVMAGLSMGLVLGTLLIGHIAQEAWPDILIGFGAVSAIILGYALIASLVNFVTKLSATFKADILTVTLMAGIAMGLVLGTLLIGYVAQLAWPDILIGFGAISGVILGYVAIADIVTFVAKLSATFRADILSVAMMAGIAMGLVLGTLLMGCIAEEAWQDIAIGFITVGAVITGFAWLARYISGVSKGLGAFQKDFITLGLFAAGCEALLLGTVAIAWVTKKAGVTVGEIILTLIGVGLIAEGLIYIAKQLQASKIGSSKKAISTLKELTLIGFACEGLLAGVIGLAVLAKKADPVYIVGVIGALGGIIYGLTQIVEYLNKHNRDLSKGAKSLLLVEGVALGAELILQGIILLAKQLNDKSLIVQIPITIGLISTIIGGMIGISYLVNKNDKDITKGAKSLLLLEGVALGAEVVLAGIIGLVTLKRFAKVSDLEIGEIIVLIGGIITGLVGITKLVEKHNKDLTKGAKSLLLLEGVALGAEVVLAGIIGLIVLQRVAKVGYGDITLTLLLIGGIITGFAGLAILVDKFKNKIKKAIPGMLMIDLFALNAGVLLLGVIGLITLQKTLGVTSKDVFLTVSSIALIIGGLGAIAILVGKFDNQIKKAIPGMLMIDLFAVNAGVLLLGVIGLVALQHKFNVSSEEILLTVTSMTLIIGGMGTIAALVGKFDNQIKKAIPGLGIITLFAAAAGVLLAGVIGLVALKNLAKADWGDVFITIGAMATIVTAFGVLGAAVGYATPLITPGLVGIGVITLFALSAEALLAGVIGLVAFKNKVNADWEDIFATIGAMATIVGAFGVLGTAIGLVTPLIVIGLAGAASISLFALSAEAILAGVIGLVAFKNKVNADWEDIDTTLNKMESIIGVYGLIGTAIGAASLLIAPALIAIPSILLLGESSILILDGVINLVDKKNKARANWEDIDIALDKMEGIITSYGLIGAAASLASPFIIAGSVGLLAAIETAKQTALLMDEVINVAGKAKKLGRDGWEQIDKTLTYMNLILVGDNANDKPGFKQLCTLASLSYPFLIAGADGLEQVALTARTAAKSLIEVCKAADAAKEHDVNEIMNVISYFGNVTNALYDLVGVQFAVKAKLISSQKGFIHNISTAAMDIAMALANMAGVAKEGGFMRAYRIKPDGGFAYGQWVNAKGSAETIVGTMSFFVDTLYNSFNKINEKSANNIEGGVKMLQGIIEPISNFAIALSAFKEAGDGKIKQIKYDDKGKLIDTPAVDVAQVAKAIGNAVSTFCNILFSNSNQVIWRNMVKGGSYSTKVSAEGGSEKVYNPGTAQIAMGVLATIIDPIANFAQTLAMFEDGGVDELIVPIYDEKGNVTNRRTIKVTAVAEKIGKAVTSFISTLSNHSKTWVEEFKKHGREAKFETRHSGFLGLSHENVQIQEAGNDMADAYGVFATVIQPVISFANLLKMFGDVSKTGELIVYEGDGKSHRINPITIADTIGSTITSFINVLSGTITKNNQAFANFDTQKDTIINAVDTLSTALEKLGNVDADNTIKFSGAFKDVMDLIYLIGDEKNNSLVKAASNSIDTFAGSIGKLTETVYGGAQNPIVVTLTSMNTLFKDISAQANSLGSIITFFQDLKAQSENFSNVIDSSVVASITTLTSSLPQASNALKESQDKFNKAVNDKKIGIKPNADKMTASFNRTTVSIKNFDKVLSGNNNNRIKNLKNLKDAVESLNSATDGIESRLANVAVALKALASISTQNAADNISRVISALGGLHTGGGFAGNMGGGSTTVTVDPTAIANAIAAAFDGTEIRLKENGNNNKQLSGYLDVPGGNSFISNNETSPDYNKFNKSKSEF